MIKELEIIKPKSSPYKLVRIGGKNDGAYLLPNDFNGILACFSPGVCNTKSFEDHLAKKYNIKSYMCDFSSDIDNFKTEIIKGMQFFEKKWLDIYQDENNISLEEWVNKYTDEPKSDLILQMDIEGAEYRNLCSCPKYILQRFRILIIELHDLASILKEGKDNKVSLLLTKINKTHICVHAHPNNCCGDVLDPISRMNIPRVIELTFLRKDRFKKNNQLVKPEIPNYMDINANVIWNRPLHLNKYWLKPHKRTIKSRIKITKDYFTYLTYKMHQKYSDFIKNKVNK